jgi:hypothetical protein
MRRYQLVGLIGLSSLVASAVAPGQNPYLHEGSIGRPASKAPEVAVSWPFRYRPIETWVGQKFIFLPEQKSMQHNGYQSVTGGKGSYGQPTYSECVGRVATVVDVTAGSTGSGSYAVKLRMDDNGQIYVAQAPLGTVDGIGPVADIDLARSMWLGKTLWYTNRELLTYDASTDAVAAVMLRRYSPVTVIDIAAGWSNTTPVRFVIRTADGAEGFADVNLSGTNVFDRLREPDFGIFFLTEDPRRTHDWSPEVWAAIDRYQVFMG